MEKVFYFWYVCQELSPVTQEVTITYQEVAYICQGFPKNISYTLLLWKIQNCIKFIYYTVSYSFSFTNCRLYPGNFTHYPGSCIYFPGSNLYFPGTFSDLPGIGNKLNYQLLGNNIKTPFLLSLEKQFFSIGIFWPLTYYILPSSFFSCRSEPSRLKVIKSLILEV